MEPLLCRSRNLGAYLTLAQVKLLAKSEICVEMEGDKPHWSGLSKSHLLTFLAFLASSHLLADLNSLKEDFTAELAVLNVTDRAHQGFLLFNRVPKGRNL